MTRKIINASARVTITVEVVTGSWGSDCTMDQLHEQAGREATAAVHRLLDGHARVIGHPKVVAIIAERE